MHLPQLQLDWSPRPLATDGQAANPGPVGNLRVKALNCTALRTQWESVKETALDADILCLGEIRLTKAGQKHFDGLFRTIGCTVAWGAPKCRKRFGSRVPPGGLPLRHGRTSVFNVCLFPLKLSKLISMRVGWCTLQPRLAMCACISSVLMGTHMPLWMWNRAKGMNNFCRTCAA